MRYFCRADTQYEDSREIFFLLDINPSTVKRLIELMEFLRSLANTHPEITGFDATIKDNLGCFLESSELIRELKKSTKRKSLQLGFSWIEIPETFHIKVDHNNSPLGTLDTFCGKNGVIVSVNNDSLCIKDYHVGTLAKLESQSIEYNFIKQLA